MIYRLFLLIWFIPLFVFLLPRPESHELVKGYSNITPYFPGVFIYVIIGIFTVLFGFFFSYPLYIGKKNSAINVNSSKQLILLNCYKKSLITFFIAAIGVLSSCFKIISYAGLPSVITSITLGTANDFREILYEGYTSMPYGLRHLIGPSTAVLIFTTLELRKSKFIIIPAIFALLLNVMISSRLSLILFILVYILCYVVFEKKISKYFIIFSGLFVLIILTVANYVRNVNYFNSFGIENPITMMIIQTRQYLETAIVGCLSYLNDPFSFPKGDYIEISNSGGEFLAGKVVQYTGIKEEFTQISGIVFLFSKVGISSLFLFPFIVGFAIGLFNFFRNKGAQYLIESGVIFYAIFDSWRTFIFIQGFFIINLVFAIIVSSIFLVKHNQSINRVKFSS